jgi:hypothetical protein
MEGREDDMSATTGAIRVRTMPNIRAWQALLLALAMALSLVLGLVIGRAISTETTQVIPGATVTFGPSRGRTFSPGHALPRPPTEAAEAFPIREPNWR